LSRSCPTRHLLSFPTRRSSDLDLCLALAANLPDRIPEFAARTRVWHLRSALVCGTDRRGPGNQAVLSRHRVGAIVTRAAFPMPRSEEHTSELQSRENLVCRLLL